MLDVVPAEGVIAVAAVSSVSRSDGRLRQMLEAVDGDGYAGVEALLQTMGLRAGIDLDGSAAVVVAAGGEPGRPPMALVVPVRDVDEFRRAVGTREEGDLLAFDYAGATYFLRPAGARHMVVGESRSALDGFGELAGESAGRRVAGLGPMATRIAANADVVAVCDAKQVGAMVRGLGIPLPVGPGAGDTGIAGTFLDRLLRLIQGESRGVLAAATFSSIALRIDIVSDFVDDGVLARTSRSGAEAGAAGANPMGAMPRQPYLFVLSIDAAHPGVRILADELGVPGRAQSVAAEAEAAVLNALPSMESLCVAVYEPASLMFGSLARTLVCWRAPMPEEGARAARAWIESLNGRPIGNAAITSACSAGPDGDSWTITPPAGAAPMVSMLLGPFPEVQGRTLVLADRGYLTWSRDATLIDGARASANANAATLAGDETLARTSTLMPEGRLAEAYLDVFPILKQFASMVVDKDVLAGLPARVAPIGACVTVEGGSACLTIIAPAETIKAFNAMRGDEEPAPKRNGNGNGNGADHRRRGPTR